MNAVDLFAFIISWTYKVVATWYTASIIGGVLILIAERRDRGKGPTDADVRRTAEKYREQYGEKACTIIGDHILAASFTPHGNHCRFLKRVSANLSSGAFADGNYKQSIEH